MRDLRSGRVILIVLDGCGVGALPDAADYGDEGADTLGHTLSRVPTPLPNLAALGLGNLHPLSGVPPSAQPRGSFGRLAELSAGKDTATGHWELMGVVTSTPFITFPEGFPAELIQAFSARSGRGVLGNKPASGTEIIEELGAEHQRTGKLIVYTSADSVFQIAAHEETVPLEELYRACALAYELVVPRGVARVIARPFRGEPGSYWRTSNRHDYTVPPPRPTILQHLTDHGVPVTGIGKIKDIYAGLGITHHLKASSNPEIMARILDAVASDVEGLIFANLVDFDMLYGHRRNAVGFAGALAAFDAALPELQSRLRPGDLLVLTADHGNDPTMPGSDHCREYVPLLVFSPARARGTDLQIRSSFADVGATLAERFHVPGTGIGRSFLQEVA